MKKITILSVAILFTWVTAAQTEFTVPNPSETQKHELAKGLCYNNILMGISFAKSQGKTVEEYAKYCGDQFRSTGGNELTFEQFVNNELYNYSVMAGKVEIIEQSESKIVFKISGVYPALKNQGALWGTTFEDLITWLETLYSQIADQVAAATFQMKIVDDGVLVTIAKK